MPIFRAAIPYVALVQIHTRTTEEALAIANELAEKPPVPHEIVLADSDGHDYAAYIGPAIDGPAITVEDMENPR